MLWDTPITLKSDFLRPKYNGNKTRSSGIMLRVGAGRNQGRRNYMEDVDFVYHSINCGTRDVSLYGVLDGHGGADCAKYVSEELPSKLTYLLRSNIKPNFTTTTTATSSSSSSRSSRISSSSRSNK